MTNDETTRGKLVRVAAALISIVVGSAAAASTATLEGRVVDWDSDAPVARTTIVATGEDVPLERVSETDQNGRFAFPLLPSGTYRLTATKAGYSIVTLVGVNLHPGERRSVEVMVAETEDEEFVTETVSDPLVPLSSSVLTSVSAGDISVLPLLTRNVSELGSVLSGMELAGARVGPLEVVRSASVRTYSYEPEFGHADGGVLDFSTRSGLGGSRLNVGISYRERLDESRTEKEAGASKRNDSVARGVIAFGGQSRYIAYFGAIEHVEEDREYVVAGIGADPIFANRSFDDSSSRTRIVGTLTTQPSMSQSLAFGISAYLVDDVAGASPLVFPEATYDVDHEAFRFGIEHSWQLGRSTANHLEIGFDGESRRHFSSAGEAWLFPSGFQAGATRDQSKETFERALFVREKFSWFSGRHETKAGFDGRFGRKDRMTLIPGTASVHFLSESHRAATDITSMAGQGEADLTWDESAVWLEDAIRIGTRWRVQAGLRVQSWGGFDVDQTGSELWQALVSQTTYNERFLRAFSGDEGVANLRGSRIDPRVSVLFEPKKGGSTSLRAGFGRFHEAPDVFEFVAPASMAANGSLGVSYHASDTSGIRTANGSLWTPGRPLPLGEVSGFVPNDVLQSDIEATETTRLSLGLTSNFGGLYAVSIDVAGAQLRNLPYALRGNPRLDREGLPQRDRRFPDFGDFRIWMFDGEADTLDVTFGAKANFFGKLNATFHYTWSDTDGNVLAWPLSGSVAEQPDGLMSAGATVDPLDPHCGRCFGPLNGDPSHRGTLTVRSDLPGGWEIGGVLAYRGGTPYTRYESALADVNHDGFRQDLAANVRHVNDMRGAASTRLDLRLSKELELAGSTLRLAFDVFNALDDDAPSAYNRFGEPTAFAGDPSQAPGRSITVDVSFELE